MQAIHLFSDWSKNLVINYWAQGASSAIRKQQLINTGTEQVIFARFEFEITGMRAITV